MNIVVITSAGKVIVRPDTTLERDGDDLYVPEFISSLSYTPVLVARICKAGRSVNPRFAYRYFDSAGFGTLLYPDDLIDGSQEGFACASCLDHSSFITPPSLAPDTSGMVMELHKDGKSIYRSGDLDCSLIVKAIADATRYCYIRRGDLIAVELQGRSALCRREDGQCRMDEFQCGSHTCDFRIIF